MLYCLVCLGEFIRKVQGFFIHCARLFIPIEFLVDTALAKEDGGCQGACRVDLRINFQRFLMLTLPVIDPGQRVFYIGIIGGIFHCFAGVGFCFL